MNVIWFYNAYTTQDLYEDIVFHFGIKDNIHVEINSTSFYDINNFYSFLNSHPYVFDLKCIKFISDDTPYNLLMGQSYNLFSFY